MRRHVRTACTVGMAVALVGAHGRDVAAVDDARLSAADDGSDWPGYGRTFDENHYSPLAQIDRGNVQRLGLAWSLDLDVLQRVDSQPLEADGVLYVAVGLSIVQAVDVRTGRRLWRYDPGVAQVAGARLRPAWGIRGLALWKDKVIVGTQDGRLLAIARATGKLVWSVDTLQGLDDATISGAPRVFGGRVVIGYGGAERMPLRGAVSCYDAATGRFLWRFHTVPGDPAKGFENDAMRMAARTWTGEWWKYGGGGTVWNAMTYDARRDRLYIGTGNGQPWNWKIRNPGGGDNLFLASIIALDAKTGRYVWHYQENPNEAWDYNAVMDIELATLDIGGRRRDVLMQAPKNGFLYVIDRDTGKLVSAEKIGKVNWASRIDLATGRPVEMPGIRYENGPATLFPGPSGVHNWQPMAFSPATGLLYIPTITLGARYDDGGFGRDWKPTPGRWNIPLATKSVPPETGSGGSLVAWDVAGGKEVWRVPTPGGWDAGVMATGGGLVFQGHLDGRFNAFDARTGAKLWAFNAGVAVVSAPITYRVDGRQYVSVMAGPPSGSTSMVPAMHRFTWDYRTAPRRLLTFVLDGKAKLAPAPPPSAEPARPLSDTGPRADLARAKRGTPLYYGHCLQCHGAGAIAAGIAPDLRASPIALDGAAFREVLRGALVANGMPKFDDLTDDQIEDIRNFVRGQAEGTAPAGAGSGP